MKRFNSITSVIDKGLATLAVITGWTYIATFASGVGLFVVNTLSATSVLFSLAIVITQNSI